MQRCLYACAPLHVRGLLRLCNPTVFAAADRDVRDATFSLALNVFLAIINTGGDNMGALKEQVIQLIRQLPDDITMDDILSELYFKLQVDGGLRELDEGKGIPHQEVRERMSKWISE